MWFVAGPVQTFGFGENASKNNICAPLSEDGNIGYDGFDQLVIQWKDDDDCMVKTFTVDLREEKCSICGKKWEMAVESWRDHYLWRRYGEHVHNSCFDRYMSLGDRDTIFNCFAAARVRFTIRSVPNEYTGNVNRPWYRIDLPDLGFFFVIGMRRRVTSIEVCPVEGGAISWHGDAEEAFRNENTTQEFGSSSVRIHAWTAEKEREYVHLLLSFMGTGEDDA